MERQEIPLATASGVAESDDLFLEEYYPKIYRYLLWLTESREVAEDLTQETFVRAWRARDRLDPRLPMLPWLHRIAHHEFLRSLRDRRPQTSLNDLPEATVSYEPNWTDAVELGELMRNLPAEERAILVLHEVQGYSSEEIARILKLPAGTVRYRLSQARERLRSDLDEGDLTYLNERPVTVRQWAWLPLDQMYALEARLARGDGSARALKAESEAEGAMERREFLRDAAAAAAGMMLPEEEQSVVDGRLTRKVTCAFKATSLADLCGRLSAETGVELLAGPTVADEKVTLFCERTPLRDVMRQLSRPFGYTWMRTKRGGKFQYELVQDLRSQLLEEELRDRDRAAALLALEQEIQKYRRWLDLSPDEALALAKAASKAEKGLLDLYAGYGWGMVQLYFRLSPEQLTALRAGRPLLFSPSPEAGQHFLPPELARGILQSLRDYRLLKQENGFELGIAEGFPEGLPVTEIAAARPVLALMLGQTNLGQFTLGGGAGFAIDVDPGTPLMEWKEAHESFPFSSETIVAIAAPENRCHMVSANLAEGRRPARDTPGNAAHHMRLARDPALQRPVSVNVMHSHTADPSRSSRAAKRRSPETQGAPDIGAGAHAEGKTTTADLLEALHHATGMPIVGDFYTRFYPPDALSVSGQPLLDALNRLADAAGLRWNRDGDWLQFRTVTFYHDRLKEVPNRLLERWSASRRRRGLLTPDDLAEIAGLADARLDAREMAEGARECWGLKEWDLLRTRHLRPHFRFFAGLTPEQRWQALRPGGLAFTQMSLSQQQQFLTLHLGGEAERMTLPREDLADATLKVTYHVLGGRQWTAPVEATGEPNLIVRPSVPEPRRQQLLAHARRFNDTRSDEAILAGTRPEPDLEFTYLIGATKERPLRRWVHVTGGNTNLR